MIQRSALMRHLKADADLRRIFPENLLIRHNDKTGRICRIVIDLPIQDLQSVNASTTASIVR